MEILGVKDCRASKLYNALIKEIKSTDEKIFNLFEKPTCDDATGCKTLLNFAEEISDIPEGFFIKEERAKEFLINVPPPNILKSLGYKNAKELVQNENIFEIYSALRFMEERDWLNNIFFKQYESLTRGDFEKRKIKLAVLNNKWILPLN